MIYVLRPLFSRSFDGTHPNTARTLTCGRDLALEVNLMTQEAGVRSVTELLEKIDSTYKERIAHRQPEEILTD